MSGCGNCTLCCTVMKVTMPHPAPPKPAHTPCQHCTGAGCAIYADRPESCQTFMCWWLGSQAVKELRLPHALRPDRTGVVLDLNSAGYVIAHCHRPDAWKRAPMRHWLLGMARRTRVLIEAEGSTHLLDQSGATVELTRIGVDPVTNETLYVRSVAA